MTANLPVRLFSLLRCGFAPDADGALAALLNGFAHPSGALGKPGWVASRVLLAQREALSSDNELVLSLLALQAEWRVPWLRIIAERCKEAALMCRASRRWWN